MQLVDEIDGLQPFGHQFVDPFDDEEPIVASCDLDSPEVCESCQ
jgi:hypothetical protein